MSPNRKHRHSSQNEPESTPAPSVFATVGGESAPQAPSPPLPCQSCNNSTENPQAAPQFAPGAAKTAYCLQLEVEAFIERNGLENCGFVTFTFADDVRDQKEAQRRKNSLFTHAVRPRYGEYICVVERQKSGRIHYHALVKVGKDIRTGANLEELFDKKLPSRQRYRTAPQALRDEWEYWGTNANPGAAAKHGFGRTEILPIQKTGKALGRYVAKYISKHLEHRRPEDKGTRLVTYGGIKRTTASRFSWAGGNGQVFRTNVATVVRSQHAHGIISAPTREAMTQRHGRHWVYKHRDLLLPTGDTPDRRLNRQAHELWRQQLRQAP